MPGLPLKARETATITFDNQKTVLSWLLSSVRMLSEEAVVPIE